MNKDMLEIVIKIRERDRTQLGPAKYVLNEEECIKLCIDFIKKKLAELIKELIAKLTGKEIREKDVKNG